MLISEQYRALNKELHERVPEYGTSSAYCAEQASTLIRMVGSNDILDYGCGKGHLAKRLGRSIAEYDPAVPGKDAPPRPADVVFCTDVLEHVEPECIDDVLVHLASLVKVAGYLLISTHYAKKRIADGRNAHILQRSPHWWISRLEKHFDLSYVDQCEYGLATIICPKKEYKGIYRRSEIALYDFSNRPASFDILTWLVTATTMGARHVRFALSGNWKPKNYTDHDRRFETICAPACELAGVDFTIGKREGITYTHLMDGPLKVYKAIGGINKLHSVKPSGKAPGYVTITLRKSRDPRRDSNEAEWMKFAKTLDREVIILRDFEEKPIGLHARMALYADAHMNFFVNNGPASLCTMSDAPYLIMAYSDPETGLRDYERSLGFETGDYPWAGAMQKRVYVPDTCENIQREYQQMVRLDQQVAA